MGLSHGQTVLVIYGICILLAVMSFVLSGTGQVYAFMGLAVAFGLGLFLLTRGESVDALEAESYEPDPAPAEVGDMRPAARIRRRAASSRCPAARIPCTRRARPPSPGRGAAARLSAGRAGSCDSTQAHPSVPDPGVTIDPPAEADPPARIGRPARSV